MKARDGFVLRDVGGSAVLVPIGARVVDFNGLVKLNDTGRCIWELLDGAHSVGDITEVLVARFAIEREQAEKDTREFLTELTRIGLLEDAPAAL